MKVVLDTNVLISGLLNPFGTPSEIVRMAASGKLMICYDARILTEYRQVMLRPKFRFTHEQVDALLDYIERQGTLAASEPAKIFLPDDDDEMFLEVAIACQAHYLITGNLKHFPANKCAGANVVSPNAFIDILKRNSKN